MGSSPSRHERALTFAWAFPLAVLALYVVAVIAAVIAIPCIPIGVFLWLRDGGLEELA